MTKKHWLILVSLVFSLFIYMFYRTEKTVVNELVIQIVSLDHFIALRQAVTRVFPLNKIAVYSLPEGLWILCITLTSKPFYVAVAGRQIDGAWMPLILCIGLEILQLFNVTNGRFDVMDILLSVIFWTIGLYAFNEKLEKRNILYTLNPRSIACIASYGIVYLAHVWK